MPSARSQVWAVVIAGGTGEPTRLVDTLGRVALEIPAERTLGILMGMLWSDLGHAGRALDVLNRRARWPREPGVGGARPL